MNFFSRSTVRTLTVRTLIVASLLSAAVAHSAIVANTPTGTTTVPQTQNLYWDMQSGNTGTSSIGAIGDFYLSDHGDIHFNDFGPGGDMAIVTGTDGAALFSAGATIDASLDWDSENSNNLFVGTTDFGGTMSPGDTAILGLRFRIAGNWHYGWVQIAEGVTDQSVVAWAYEDTPGTAIRAGAANSSNSTAIPALPLPGLLLTIVVLVLIGTRRISRRR